MHSITLQNIEREFVFDFVIDMIEELDVSEGALEFFAHQLIKEIRLKFCQYFSLNADITSGATDSLNFIFYEDKFTRDFTMLANQIKMNIRVV